MTKIYREYHIVMSEQRKLKENEYAAISYTDHYCDSRGEYRTVRGTEDFSLQRWGATKRNHRAVYIPTGEVNKGGHRTWEYFGTVYARSTTDACKIARLVMGDREISIRAN